MPHELAQGAAPFRLPARLPLDVPLSVRFSDWSAGWDHEVAQSFHRQAEIDPVYFDAQNVDAWNEPGTLRLCPAWNRIGSADGTDYEYLLVPFNTALYRLWTAGADPGAAERIKKVSSATGTPSWAAIANNYTGATAIRGHVVWRDQLCIVANEQGANAIRVMSTAEAWSLIAAAAPAPTNKNASMIGLAHDDRLLVYYESDGLYAYDGSAWAKIFPPASNPGAAADKFCDVIARGLGSTLFVTRDTTGTTTLWEWAIEPAGTVFNAWLHEPGLRIWPQGIDTYADTVWIGGRLGAHENRGVLWHKDRLQPPIEVTQIYSNGATAGQDMLDWGVRCVYSVGDVLYFGASSRQDHNGTVYRLTVEEDGDIIHPAEVIASVAGPIYSLAHLPYAATGASSSDRLHASIANGTFYRDAEDSDDPTTDATSGFTQLPDVDLGVPDHDKIWHFLEVFTLSRSTRTDGVDMQYRADPSGPDAGWTSLGVLELAPGLTHLDFPDDDPTTAKYGLRARLLQLRLVFNRPTSGTTRDVIDTMNVVAARYVPLGESAT